MSSKSLQLYGGSSCIDLSFKHSVHVLYKNCFVHAFIHLFIMGNVGLNCSRKWMH